jgi:hypothetical protein
MVSRKRSNGLSEFADLAGLTEDERCQVRLGRLSGVTFFGEHGWPQEWVAERASALKSIDNAQRRYGLASAQAKAARSRLDGLIE